MNDLEKILLDTILSLAPPHPLSALRISQAKLRKHLTEHYLIFMPRQVLFSLLGELQASAMIHFEQARGSPRTSGFSPNTLLIYPTLKGRGYFSSLSSIEDQGEEREVTS